MNAIMLQIHTFVFKMSWRFPLSVGLAQIQGHNKVKKQTHSVNSSNMYLWYRAGGSNWERERQQRGREEGNEGDAPASFHAQPLFMHLSNDGYFCFQSLRIKLVLMRVLIFSLFILFAWLIMQRDLNRECDKRKDTEHGTGGGKQKKGETNGQSCHSKRQQRFALLKGQRAELVKRWWRRRKHHKKCRKMKKKKHKIPLQSSSII